MRRGCSLLVRGPETNNRLAADHRRLLGLGRRLLDRRRDRRRVERVDHAAVGGPKWDKVGYDVRPEAGLLRLRKDLDLYANVRPIRLFPNVRTPLAANDPDSIDYIILRESSEGLYLSRGVGLRTRDAATDSMMIMPSKMIEDCNTSVIMIAFIPPMVV